MAIPNVDQIKRALHLGETIEKLEKQLASLFGKTLPRAAKSAGSSVLQLVGLGGGRKRRKLSRAARQAIAAAQKRRWAKVKGGAAKPQKVKAKTKTKSKSKACGLPVAN